MCVRQRQRQRDRDRERKRETETERETERQRQRQREKERQRQRVSESRRDNRQTDRLKDGAKYILSIFNTSKAIRQIKTFQNFNSCLR